MKKVLIGVGIGCGVLILAGVIAVVAGGFWVKSKVEAAAQSGERAQAVEKRVAAANERFAFNPPPPGVPLQLTEPRLQDYLEIHTALEPLLKDFEAKGKALQTKEDGLSKSMQAFSLLADLRAELRTKWLEELERQQMSPREFGAITATISTSGVAAMKAQMPTQMQKVRQVQGQLKEQLQKQIADESLPQEARAEARRQLERIEEQLAKLSRDETKVSPEFETISQGNLELVQKYSKQLSKLQMGMSLAFLLGTEDAENEEFLKAMRGSTGLEPEEAAE